MNKRIQSLLPAALAASMQLLLEVGCGRRAGDEPGSPFVQSDPAHVVCIGRVEPVEGEIEVSTQMAGTLEAVWVREGDWVEKGTLLATVDARREQAHLHLAEARLARIKAGSGAEEIAAVVGQREALEAQLAYAESELQRAHQLHTTAVIGESELQSKKQQTDSLRKQVESLRQQAAALKRGPLPEEITVAQVEVEGARTDCELCLARALCAGVILHLYRHAGDYVSVTWPTPLLRMADTNHLLVRVEAGESEAAQIQSGKTGRFTVFGMTNVLGRLRVGTVLPSFAPKRLCDPDGNARLDTRTLQALCDILETGQPVCSGQRVFVRFDP